MLTDQELGELVVKVQMDDVRPRELVTFLSAVTSDGMLRKNLKLAGKVSHLERDIRLKNCRANILFLLCHSTLGPEADPKESTYPHRTTREFAETFHTVTISLWKKHAKTTVVTQAKANLKNKGVPKPDVALSSELYLLLRALEDFWDVGSTYLM